MIEVRLATRSRLVTTVVGNAITLTPGTMTLDVRHDDDGYVLDVHVLGTVDHTEFAASIAGLGRGWPERSGSSATPRRRRRRRRPNRARR
ncbi:MAG: Na+/H+ antiporter subunit E [Ilumatobacteraceae bacterium]